VGLAYAYAPGFGQGPSSDYTQHAFISKIRGQETRSMAAAMKPRLLWPHCVPSAARTGVDGDGVQCIECGQTTLAWFASPSMLEFKTLLLMAQITWYWEGCMMVCCLCRSADKILEPAVEASLVPELEWWTGRAIGRKFANLRSCSWSKSAESRWRKKVRGHACHPRA
jgi:hypothetical protein